MPWLYNSGVMRGEELGGWGAWEGPEKGRGGKHACERKYGDE